MSSKVILWNFFRSSPSWRVRIALNLKGIDYEYRPINLTRNEQYSKELTELNAKQEIPILKIDNTLFVQSLPIIEYIDETRTYGSSLLPKDPIKRAHSRAIAEIINSGIQPYQNPNVKKRISTNFGEAAETEWLQFYLHKGFRAIEKLLEEHSGTYCIGDSLSIADLFLVPQVYAAKRFQVDLAEYQNVKRVCMHLEKIPEFKRAHAHRQLDTPTELRED